MTTAWQCNKYRITAAISLLAALAFWLPTAQAQGEGEEIEEITVTGTQIKGASISDALPVSVISSEDIEALGIDSGADLLEFMAEQGQNFFSESENISGGVNSARGDIGAYNLRNLGTGNTLVLLNGRRMVNSASYQTEAIGGSFIPVNTVNSQSLPIFALERVEVLRDGASAIYGADAVAGVVNYVLKKDYEGFDVRLRYAGFDNTSRDDQRVTLGWGKNFNEDRTNLTLSVDYYRRDRVNSQDDPRWATSELRPRVPAGSPWEGSTAFRNTSVNSEYGQYDMAGSIAGITDSNGEFETYPIGDPRCTWPLGYGTCGSPDGQGTYRYNNNENRDLYSALDRVNVYAFLNHEFDSGLESFTEFSYYMSNTNTLRHASTKLGAVAAHRVAADNYWNPFGPIGSPNRLPDAIVGAGSIPPEGIELAIDNYRWAQVPRVVDNDGETFRFLTGLRGTMGDWDWESAITWSKAEKEDITHNRISNTALDAALNDPTPAAINQFSGRVDTNIEQVLIDVFRLNETELKMIDFKMSKGDLFELPAGPVGFLAGVEFREESFIDDRDPRLDGTINYVDNSGNTYPLVSDVANSSPTADSSGDRNVTSVFGELQVPVFESLDVQLAIRYEDFSDVGNSTVGKFAVGWRPIEPLLFRASWSEAFRVPNLVTVNEGGVARSNTRNDSVCFFADPDENVLDCRHSVQRTAAGSNQLISESSTNTSIGVVWDAMDSLTFTLDFWEIEKDDTIGLFGEENHSTLDLLFLIEQGTADCANVQGNPATVRDDPTLLDPIDQAIYLAAGICPSGELIRVDDRYENLDTRTVRGYDIGAYYNFDTDFGNFDFRYVASFLDEYTQTPGGAASVLLAAKEAGILPPTVPVTGFASLVRQDGNAESKHTFRASWRRNAFGVAVSGVRLDDFIQTSLTLADGTEYVIPSMTTWNANADYRFETFGSSDTTIRVGMNNVTDERAPLADDSFGYFADMHQDLGRSYYVDVNLRF